MKAIGTKRNRERARAAGLVAVGLLALAACGPDDDQARSPAATQSEQSTDPASDATTPSRAAQTSRSADPSTPADPSATGESKATTGAGMGSDCTTADLTAAIKRSGEEMNSKYFDLTLTNTSKGTCALEGYPGLSLTDGNGKPIGKPATRSHNGNKQSVVLKPGNAAHAVVQTPRKEVTDGKCWPEPARIKVYPPNNTAALTAPAPSDLQVCGDTFTVGPMTARPL